MGKSRAEQQSRAEQDQQSRKKVSDGDLADIPCGTRDAGAWQPLAPIPPCMRWRPLHAVHRLSSSSVSIETLSGKTMVFPVSAVRGGMCAWSCMAGDWVDSSPLPPIRPRLFAPTRPAIAGDVASAAGSSVMGGCDWRGVWGQGLRQGRSQGSRGKKPGIEREEAGDREGMAGAHQKATLWLCRLRGRCEFTV